MYIDYLFKKSKHNSFSELLARLSELFKLYHPIKMAQIKWKTPLVSICKMDNGTMIYM
jgi:hypothetical protein